MKTYIKIFSTLFIGATVLFSCQQAEEPQLDGQGRMGDVDCALLIARHYKTHNDAEALGAFTDRVKLRYDSDTRKVKSLK